MPKIQKKFDITISKKFPDGSLGVIAYGTAWEDIVDRVDEDTESDLFQKAYNSTLADVKNSSKIDPLVKSIWREMRQQLANESLVNDAQRKNAADKKAKNRNAR